MDGHYILFKVCFGWLLVCLCVQSQVNGPFRMAVKDGIGRHRGSNPLHRRLPHYPPRQVKQHQQQQGFMRNVMGSHPHRPTAPVSHHNHLAAVEFGNRGRVRPTNKQRYNHPQYPHNQPTAANHNRPESIDPYRPNSKKTQTTTTTTTEIPELSSHDTPLVDPHNYLQLQATEDEYLTYLYLTPEGTRLEQEYMRAAAAAYVPDDQVNHQPSIDHETTIKAPIVDYDPYKSGKGKSKLGKKQTKVEEITAIQSLEDDWQPIHSPWEKYRKKSKSNLNIC